MSYTRKGAKWEILHSIPLLFSFIPFVNSLVLFYMSARTGIKKWRTIGWVLLIINISTIIGINVCNTYSWVNLEEYPDNRPKLEDYLGYDYYNKYQSYYDYQNLEEYYEYEKAVDEWENSEEVKRIRNRNEEFSDRFRRIRTALQYSTFYISIIVFFFVLSQRAEFIKAYANGSNKEELREQLQRHPINGNTPPINRPNHAPASDNTQVKKKKKHPTSDGEITDRERKVNKANKYNVNTITEEEIASLPGLTVVDAKRAIQYRKEHNGFKNVDEFFDAINIKPHIMVKIQNKLYVEKKNSNASNKSVSNTSSNTSEGTMTKRRIDL